MIRQGRATDTDTTWAGTWSQTYEEGEICPKTAMSSRERGIAAGGLEGLRDVSKDMGP